MNGHLELITYSLKISISSYRACSIYALMFKNSHVAVFEKGVVYEIKNLYPFIFSSAWRLIEHQPFEGNLNRHNLYARSSFGSWWRWNFFPSLISHFLINCPLVSEFYAAICSHRLDQSRQSIPLLSCYLAIPSDWPSSQSLLLQESNEMAFSHSSWCQSAWQAAMISDREQNCTKHWDRFKCSTRRHIYAYAISFSIHSS